MHELEIINGVAQIAYTGETPWHTLGKKQKAGCSPKELARSAGADFRVVKVPLSTTFKGRKILVPGEAALLRERDGKFLSIVGEDWHEIQNAEAIEFFDDFVKEGKMEMSTAGVLRDGQIVWILAKMKHGFKVGRKDDVETFLLFSNPHVYGHCANIMVTPTRVVCMNTLRLALKNGSDLNARIHHHKKFLPEEVKRTLGLITDVVDAYSEKAKFLASKDYDEESYDQFIRKVFPVTTAEKAKRGELSRAAVTAKAVLETQPGANLSPGSWWNAFNSITFSTDHLLGRSEENRLFSMWYGRDARRKEDALNMAVEFAKKA